MWLRKPRLMLRSQSLMSQNSINGAWLIQLSPLRSSFWCYLWKLKNDGLFWWKQPIFLFPVRDRIDICHFLLSVTAQNRKLGVKWYSVSSFKKKWLKSPYFSLSDFSMGKGGAAELGGIGLKPWLPLIFLENRNFG